MGRLKKKKKRAFEFFSSFGGGWDAGCVGVGTKVGVPQLKNGREGASRRFGIEYIEYIWRREGRKRMRARDAHGDVVKGGF